MPHLDLSFRNSFNITYKNKIIMKYSNIKSPVIKSYLKKTRWEDRNYIDDLIQLHKYMTTGVKSWIAASLFSDLIYKYQKEYLILIEEDKILNPNEKRAKIHLNKMCDIIQRNKKILQWKL